MGLKDVSDVNHLPPSNSRIFSTRYNPDRLTATRANFSTHPSKNFSGHNASNRHVHRNNKGRKQISRLIHYLSNLLNQSITFFHDLLKAH